MLHDDRLPFFCRYLRINNQKSNQELRLRCSNKETVVELHVPSQRLLLIDMVRVGGHRLMIAEVYVKW